MKKHNPKNTDQNKVKAYQELNEEISENEKLAQRKPTPQPQDFDEIEY